MPHDRDYTLEQSLLKGWCAITSRLLNQGGSQAWHVIDDALRLPNDDSGGSKNTVRDLNAELEALGLIRQLRPARTQSDAKAADLLRILQGHRITSHVSTDDWLRSLDLPETSTRGDRSVFLGHTLKQQEQAGSPTRCPLVSYLVGVIERTVQHHVTSVDFDLSGTSVQLAEYPGDGVSGYPRHCDRDGSRCLGDTNRDDASGTKEAPARMITAVYYLTPEDWDAERDGGCLRLYAAGSARCDIAPYSNRLVLFRSDGVEHQVLPSKRLRRALTVWLYGRLKPKPFMDEHLLPREASPIRADVTSPPPPVQLTGPTPLLIDDEETDAVPSIFVMIPAYRDTETGPTIRSLMATARHPSRVYVGLVLQVDTTGDQDRLALESLPTEQAWYHSQVRVLTLDARHANGPCPARLLCQSLHRGEEYVLGIDAHMRFRPNWDSYLIRQLHQCASEKAVLTTYPPGYRLPNTIPDETRGTKLAPWKFDQDGMFRQKATFFAVPPAGPTLTHMFAAGFHFARSSLIRDCPYQNLPHLFFGEEGSMAVRLYVAGYDLYAPQETVCYHLWSRSHRPPPLSTTPCRVSSNIQRRDAMLKVHQQLTTNEAHSGPAMLRDVLAFGSAIGVDFKLRSINLPRDDSGLEDVSSSETLN